MIIQKFKNTAFGFAEACKTLGQLHAWRFVNLIALKNPNTPKFVIVVLKPAFSGGIVVAFFGFCAKLPVFEMSDKESVEY